MTHLSELGAKPKVRFWTSSQLPFSTHIGR